MRRNIGLVAGIALVFVVLAMQAAEAAKITSLAEAATVLAKPELSAADVDALATFFRNRYKGKDLTTGDAPALRTENPDGSGLIGFVLQADPHVKVEAKAGNNRRWLLRPLGQTGLHARVEAFPNPSGANYWYVINNRKLVGSSGRFAFEKYTLTPDSLPQDGVPKGKLLAMPRHKSAEVYPGAERDWWIYVPAQYKPDGAAALMVFQDGKGYTQGDGNVPTVLDNLIHQKKVPVMLAVFIQPGEIARPKGPFSNRGNEYDTCTGQYARFLETEIFPVVRAEYPFSDDPEMHGICGGSSGGSCAFTAAWHRPDLFRKVLSFIGSFDDFRPLSAYPTVENPNLDPNDFAPWKVAHSYPGLIRKTWPPKPIRVYLQDGRNDLDNDLGNWFLGNEQMAAALEYSDYQYKFVTGEGAHNRNHEKLLLPSALTWLWNPDEP